MKKLLCLLALAGLLPLSAQAEFVGINFYDFRGYYKSQKESNWCWASSVSMVLAYEGVPLTQEKIVQFIKNSLANKPATDPEIVRAVNKVFDRATSGSQRKIVMSGTYIDGPPLPTVLYNQMREKKPIILTYQDNFSGHAVVLTAVNGWFDNAGSLVVDKVYVFDPYAYIWTPSGYQFSEDLVYREYELLQTSSGLMLMERRGTSAYPVGKINAAILMGSSVNDIPW